jgi:type VI secretion system protein ImpG
MRGDGWENLLEFYSRELTYLRKAGGEFAKRYPKIAQRLEVTGHGSSDPHVERLLESFAFLTARIQRDIESEFPEVTSALLGVLYPQFLNPIPSLATAQFIVDPTQGKITSGYEIARHTSLFAETLQALPCRFRTCYSVVLWPVMVSYAGFESTDQFNFLDQMPRVATVLRLRIQMQQDAGSLKELTLKQLRFHLSGDLNVAFRLYELLFGNTFKVAILPEGSKVPVFLPNDSIKPVGFGTNEDVLPYPAHAHTAYGLLQEYFTFPEKFLFFDLDNLDRHGSDQAFDVLFMFDSIPRQRLAVDQETFRLGCTPIINLFRKTTEPIRLDQRQIDYPLVPDFRRERTTEIHSIQTVSLSSNPEEQTRQVQPFFSFTHQAEMEPQTAFWFTTREPAVRKDMSGTEMSMRLVDLDFKPAAPPAQTLFAHTLCTNRRLAEQVPMGALLQIEEAAPASQIVCLTKPTPQLDPPLAGATLWRLISHLSVNFLSLSNDAEGLKALREILALYSYLNDAAVTQQVSGIRALTSKRVVRRIGTDAWRGFSRGVEVELFFDEELYVGNSAFLFGAVLNRFFALYASVNSFTQLVIRSKQREGIWKKWPAVIGEQIVL